VTKGEKELADELYRRRHDTGEWSQEATAIETRPGPTAVVSCRLPISEFVALEEASTRLGESISEYVRRAIALRREGSRYLPAIHSNSIAAGHVEVTVAGATVWRSAAPRSFSPADYPTELKRVPA
jgi:hypothetical protein